MRGPAAAVERPGRPRAVMVAEWVSGIGRRGRRFSLVLRNYVSESIARTVHSVSVNDNAVGMLSDPASHTPLCSMAHLLSLSRSADEAVDMTASLVSRPHAPLPTRHDTSSRIIAATCQGDVSCVPAQSGCF